MLLIRAVFISAASLGVVLSLGCAARPSITALPAPTKSDRSFPFDQDAETLANLSTDLVAWWPLNGHPHDQAGERDLGIEGATFRRVAGRVGLSIERAQDCATADRLSRDGLPWEGSLHHVRDNFSYCIWVHPTKPRPAVQPSLDGTTGEIGNMRPVIFPDHGGSSGSEAGSGLTVGTDGLTLYELADTHVPATLVFNVPLNGWVHIGVVFSDNQPTVYVNGVLAVRGVRSQRSVFASGSLGNRMPAMGKFDGQLSDYMVFRRSLSASDLAAIYRLTGPAPASPKTPLTQVQLESCWNDLAAESHMTLGATWRLICAGNQAVAFVATRLRTREKIAAVSDAAIDELIRRLNAENWTERETAASALLAQGPRAVSRMKQALLENPIPETTARLNAILLNIAAGKPRLSAEEIRRLRALYVLTRIDSSAAREAVANLSAAASSVAAKGFVEATETPSKP